MAERESPNSFEMAEREPLNSSEMPDGINRVVAGEPGPLTVFNRVVAGEPGPLTVFNRVVAGEPGPLTVLNSRNNNEPVSKVFPWNKRDIRIIGIVVMVIILTVVVVAVLCVKLRNANQRQDGMESPMAIPKHIVNTVYRILGNMDEKKKPCDDFWLHSCGGYIESHPYKERQDYRREMGVKAEMQDSTDEEVIRLLEEPTTESTIEPVKMVRNFYRSCTDKVTIEKTVKSFMSGLSEKLGGVPIITGNKYSSDHATTLRTLISVTGDLPWLQYYILDGPKRNHTIIRLRLKLNCNVYILLRTITTIGLMFGSPDRVDKILNFCRQTSQMQVLPMDDNFFNGKIYRESDITQHLPSLELVSLFKYIVNTSSKPASSFLFIIDDMSVFKRFDHLVLETDTKDFINIAFLQILQEFYGMIPTIGMYLADSISNLGVARNYIQSNSNLSSIPAQKKTCLDIAYLSSDVLGWLYSKKYFDKQVQEQAKYIAKYLEKSMEKVLSERKWLTQESRESAKNIIKKLSKKVHVGSQHSQQAEAKLIKRYENLKLSDNFLENTFALKKRRTQLIISDMLKNDMNQVSDMDIQAVYYVVNNSIHIPIAMLQPPVFYKGAPMALNFAGLGT
ncbi:EEF1AKMT4-ECE2 readthrough transcript protein-like [Octopus sinensis]|uniref:EEF1AKMT4-ECE2 readthrough transcript protein-like n=1 Tax=Octopus sinensis TaxID=2607531 RepID=A0A6P7SNT3_9MOLL|nr:EEF1AKMT4-ECE2 readthrough transcript protein-like [Octopus sinensis]